MREFNDLVNKMTHRQRRDWARAGYPGLGKKDLAALSAFVTERMPTPVIPGQGRRRPPPLLDATIEEYIKEYDRRHGG